MKINFHTDQFAETLTPWRARLLFKECVRFVEIKTFTYCNRTCWFCPNARMPERQDKAGNRYMDEGLYLRILGDLASVDYDGQIQFGRYNEPLADRIILTRIAQAREKLPAAFLYTHTNGDYLRRRRGKDYLRELAAAGLNLVALQTYLGNDERYDEAAALARQTQQLEELGLVRTRALESTPGRRHFYETNALELYGLALTIDARNFDAVGSDAIGTDRGGLVSVNVAPEPRQAPCLLPFMNVYIDWNGNTVPCCNLRSDRPEHAAYVVSRLADGASLFDAYVALHGWRKALLRFGPKGSPCDTCRHEAQAIPDNRDNRAELERIYAQLTPPARKAA